MKTKPAPRTTQEKLRGLVNLQSVSGTFYTQKDIAAKLGISTRTLRRFRNVPGHKLAARTVAKIKPVVAGVDRRVKRMVDAGTVVKIRTYLDEKGRLKRERYFTKDNSIKLPPSRILQIPKVFTGKAGVSLNVFIDLKGMATTEKISYVVSVYLLNEYSAFTIRVKVPAGYVYIPSFGFITAPEDDEDEEETKAKSHFVTEGPYSLEKSAANRNNISVVIVEKETAGGEVVAVSFYKNLAKKNGRGKNEVRFSTAY